MKRRQFITRAGGAAAACVSWPLAARAQRGERTARIGYLGLAPTIRMRPFDDAFREGLRDLGYVEGRNLQIEYRSAEGREDRLPALAAELVALSVDVIVTYASGVFAAQRATATIPIVMATYANVGIVGSLARPGGNITGSTFFLPELTAKRLEMLKEVVPSMTRAGVLLQLRDDIASNRNMLEAMAPAAKALDVGLLPTEVREPKDYEGAFAAWAEQQIGGLIMTDHAQLIANAGAIASLAVNHRLPSIGPLELPASGGLLAYGVDFSVLFRRAATFVDKILKGARPGDIPVEQATKFKSLLNLRTAKSLGLDVPTSILLRADEVIE
jgi:putative tryptophan/tyrosine transport system substrate-binding protein